MCFLSLSPNPKERTFFKARSFLMQEVQPRQKGLETGLNGLGS